MNNAEQSAPTAAQLRARIDTLLGSIFQKYKDVPVGPVDDFVFNRLYDTIQALSDVIQEGGPILGYQVEPEEQETVYEPTYSEQEQQCLTKIEGMQNAIRESDANPETPACAKFFFYPDLYQILTDLETLILDAPIFREQEGAVNG